MGLAIGDEHVALAATVRRWVEARDVVGTARKVLDAPADLLPDEWDELVEMGWMQLAVSEAGGGQGFGLSELCVVLEELGRGVAPGPSLTTAVVATAVDRWGDSPLVAASLADGAPGAIALHADLRVERGVVTGRADAVWNGEVAGWFLVPATDAGAPRWILLERDDVAVRERPSFDPTRRLSSLEVDHVPLDRVHRLAPDAEVARLATLLAGAEGLGVADWCVSTASAYAVERVQFGRPIGQFQAVKHRCADMLVTLEMARASVWDAARAFDEGDPVWRLAADLAAALASDAAFRCAKDCVQVLGGIGYTWEHDAHLFLKRATAMRHLLAPPEHWRAEVAAATAAGERRTLAIDLSSVHGPDAAAAAGARDAVRAFVAELRQHDKSQWRAMLADSGYLTPHWPAPHGLDATPIEQLVIDEELSAAHVRRPHLAVAGWALPTIIAHGSLEQQERFVGPTLRGELAWCQMFSEPGAGSDLASLSTRATKVDGGWVLNGQKVWTTLAKEADVAICLARTDPDAPRHEGIGCFLLDMTTPGIDIRPLRELTGMAMFNEVFLTDVFVPDADLVGSPTGGWTYARTTLANERVSMSSGSSFGPGLRG
ncbi:MAG TPA: acyl-CoA dehydrogenase, partial [Acidimicrobiales bacterium]|nr:acyl-CoA dehydrogenase [Acidimicrobiales bacterium]